MSRILTTRAQRRLIPVILVCGVILGVRPALATGAISQGFSTDDTTVTGSLMDLQSKAQGVVELANSDRANQLIGVVGNKSLIELGDSKQIQVVTSGLAVALVSDINGSITTGDRITASPISGIGMKATKSTVVVGTAQAAMSASTDSKKQQITDKKGASHTVTVATIPIQVNVTYFVANDDRLSPLVPSFLQSLGDAIAGQNVSALRVALGFLALLLGFVLVIFILYAAIRSGIVAIGRNPLAQGAVRRGLLEVVLTAAGVLVLTIMVIYVILAA